MTTKRLIIALATTLASLSGMAQKTCKIEGTVAKELNSQKMYIYVSDKDMEFDVESKDSAEVKEGKFSYTRKTSDIRGIILIPAIGNGAEGISMNRVQTILVPGEEAKVEITKEAFTIGGTTFYQQWGNADKTLLIADNKVRAFAEKVEKEAEGKSMEELNALRDKIIGEYTQLVNERKETLENYIKTHKDEAGAVACYTMLVNPNGQFYDEATDAVKQSKVGKMLKALVDKNKASQEARAKKEAEAENASSATAEGKMFVDFEAKYEGKVQKLSDYVGKGKYVLVDFWASWCGPCKAEIPNLIEVYNKHKGDKFTVLGVATWDKPKDTLKAIEQLGIPYPQIMNAENAGSDAYGILGIPEIILFGPDGTILKRGLRGSAIEKMVEEIVK